MATPPRAVRRGGAAWLVLVGFLVVAGGAALLLLGGHESPPAEPAGGSPGTGSTPWFEERAAASGIGFRTSYLPEEQGENFKINFYDHGSAVAVGDFDGDGLDDLYFCNQLGPNALYRNLGGAKFEDVTARAGPVALPDRVSVSAAWADYDNDGREDLYVTTTMGGNALFHNEGDGAFADVTKKAGVDLVAHSQSATFFDADGDGFLDLLVSDTAKWTRQELDPVLKYYKGGSNLFDLVKSAPEDNVFYRNRGDGTFEDRTKESGLAGTGWSGDTAVFDFDEDGDQDVLVVNMFGASHLYENDGKGRFTEVTKRVLGRVSWGAVGAKAFDYDDDGHLDLLLVDMHSDMWMNPDYAPAPGDTAKKYGSPMGPFAPEQLDPVSRDAIARMNVKKDDVLFGNSLFVSRGDWAKGGGRFEEVSDKAGVETLWPWGVAVGDYDGDGYLDAYIPSGMGYPFTYLRNPLLMNRGDGTFADKTLASGPDPMPGEIYAREKMKGRRVARSSRAAATADFDRDGRVDIVVNEFNGSPMLLMNALPRRHWLEVKLVGTRSNRDAVGAVLRLKVGNKTLTRQVDAAGGYLAQSSLVLHFALGDATKIDDAEVTWPRGTKQKLSTLELGKLNTVVEPK